MTSNIGSQAIQQLASEGASEEELLDATKDALKERFLPEFLNRIDETIVFQPLKKEEIRKIVRLQLDRLEKQLAENQIRFEVSDEAIDAIADEGYDPAFGARPLKRVIQRKLQNPLATELLKGHFPEGSGIRVLYEEGEFVFQPLEVVVSK
jgi:ATP-dependent Clp protease ATP-binding subunit ClpB